MTNITKQKLETLKQNFDISGDGVANITKNGMEAWGNKLRGDRVDIQYRAEVSGSVEGSTITVRTEIHGSIVELLEQVADLEEQVIREGLIKLGWTPPENGEY